MTNLAKESLQWVCNKFNLKVVSHYQDENNDIVILQSVKSKMVIPFYIADDGQFITRQEDCFYEVVISEIGDWF